MRSLAVSILLDAATEPGAGRNTGEFSAAEVEAWNAEARRARRNAWWAAMLQRLAARPPVARAIGNGT